MTPLPLSRTLWAATWTPPLGIRRVVLVEPEIGGPLVVLYVGRHNKVFRLHGTTYDEVCGELDAACRAVVGKHVKKETRT